MYNAVDNVLHSSRIVHFLNILIELNFKNGSFYFPFYFFLRVFKVNQQSKIPLKPRCSIEILAREKNVQMKQAEAFSSFRCCAIPF